MNEGTCDKAMELRITRPDGTLMANHLVRKFGPRMPVGTLFVEDGRLVLRPLIMETDEPEPMVGLVRPGEPWIGNMNFAVVEANA